MIVDTHGHMARQVEPDPRVLRFVIAMIGPDHVMLGPMNIVAAAGLASDQVAAVNGGTAVKLSRLQ